MPEEWSPSIRLSLDPSLEALADDPRLAAAVDVELTELLDVLGLPGRPRCEVRVGEPARSWGVVTVNGRDYGAPAPVLSRIQDLVTADQESVRRSHTRVGEDRVWLAALLADGSDDARQRALRFCVQAVRTVLTRHLQHLADSAAADSLRRRLDLQTPVDEVAAILREVLRMRLSVRDPGLAPLFATPGLSVEERVELFVEALLPPEVTVLLPPAYLREVTEHGGTEAAGLLGYVREGLLEELGVLVPPIRLRPDQSAPARTLAVRVNHVTSVPFAGLAADEVLVNEIPAQARALGLTVLREVRNPASDQVNVVVPLQEHQRAVDAGRAAWPPLSYLSLAVAAVLRENAACFVDRQAVERQLSGAAAAYPALVQQLRELVDPVTVARVIRALLREGIPVRDLRSIAERMLDLRLTPVGDRLAFVRQGLARPIAARVAGRSRTIPAYLVAGPLEDALRATPVLDGTAERVLSVLHGEIRALPEGVRVPVLLTSPDVRVSLRGIVAAEHPRMHVLAYGEVPEDFDIQPVARLAATD